MKGNNGIKFIVVILLIAVLTYLAAFGMPALGIKSLEDMRYGTDIKGGVSGTLYADVQENQTVTFEQLQAAEGIINTRLDDKGIFDRNVAVDKENNRIVVEIPYAPGEKDLNPQKAIDEIGETALLTFQEVDENLYDENPSAEWLREHPGQKKYLPTGKVVLNGENVKDAGVATDPDRGLVVTLDLDEKGAKDFAEATARMIRKKIAIFMDDTLITAPSVDSAITNGKAVITGQSDIEEAKALAAKIRSGALPFKLVAKEINSISPTLGEGALTIAIYAGIVAFILVFLFMLVFYRLPGLLANISLFGLVVVQLVILSNFGISLTLPGIAGIILSVGMGVDANVIIFERIKEELRTGKTLRASVDVGFKRAFSAILDANITTVITGVVLYQLGTGPIKGFAVTLILGVVLSFLTAITASKIMLKFVSGLNTAKNKWLYGA